MSEQLSIFEQYERDCAKADRIRSKADEWVRTNHDAWWYIVSRANEYVHEEKRFAIADLCEEVRWRKKAEGVDSFKVNNDIRAELARRLIRQNPAVKPYIETRSSVLDIA